jgi:hypothetical protein
VFLSEIRLDGYKTEMVNRSRMQSRLPAVARAFVPQTKQRKANVTRFKVADDALRAAEALKRRKT